MRLWSMLFNEWRFYRVQPQFWLSVLLALAYGALVNLNSVDSGHTPGKGVVAAS